MLRTQNKSGRIFLHLQAERASGGFYLILIITTYKKKKPITELNCKTNEMSVGKNTQQQMIINPEAVGICETPWPATTDRHVLPLKIKILINEIQSFS